MLCMAGLFALTFISCSNTNKVIVKTAKSTPVYKLQGKVVTDNTERAIPDAIVWVEGTTIRTTTNDAGSFSLEMPQGQHKLKVEAKNYYPKFESVQVAGATKVGVKLSSKKAMGAHESSGFSGSSETDKMQAISNKKNKRQKQMEEFINFYINNELNCKLLNPEDVHFEDTGKNEMWVKKPAKLTVKNNDLGYKVIVHLKEFVATRYSEIVGINSDATYFFEELKPEDEEEKARWEANRQKYFDGSLRHFLIAMASNKSPRYFGYRMFSGQYVSSNSAMAYSSSDVSDIEVEKYNIFTSMPNGNTWLQLDDELRIEYVGKGVDDPLGITGLDLYKYQTSWLSLSIPRINFTPNGNITTPEYVEVKGGWRYTPVCKMLPQNYLPKIK